MRNLSYTDHFIDRHIGPDDEAIEEMLEVLGLNSLDALSASAVPESIRTARPLEANKGQSEYEIGQEFEALGLKNKKYRSFIGLGYADCITPGVIQRNILENPGWYTQYTPYQAEIAQGRLEALLNFQTMVIDLTGMEISNASLLDEATAAAEAMAMVYSLQKKKKYDTFFVAKQCHPQIIAVVKGRAAARGWKVEVGDYKKLDADADIFGVLIPYPASDGLIEDYRSLCEAVHKRGAKVVVAADILALTLLTPPGEFGADVVVGSTQRLGMPMGYGGPHAAYFATRSDFKRQVPGRLIGVSQDAHGNPALRMALQTREQHIRREKATSNICTAQVLPAIVASMYAVYHGAQGLTDIAQRIHDLAQVLASGAQRLGFEVVHQAFFDTICLHASTAALDQVVERGLTRQINFLRVDPEYLIIALDEPTNKEDLKNIFFCLGEDDTSEARFKVLCENTQVSTWKAWGERQSAFLTHPVFKRYHSETTMQRYIFKLQSRDISLIHSMIPLGSCTMKLNAVAEMAPITWPAFADIHPFVPIDQAMGYQQVIKELEESLRDITGFDAISLQPNAGSQGEYAGLLAIRAYHESQEEEQRRICLIPVSAHGTNPASAHMAGLEVVLVACDEEGNIDLTDLTEKVNTHAQNLAALMVTYPSTHGVFEEEIRQICEIVHGQGGQVYMDGANMNALVGLCRPAEIGIDVCHLNLHKTFCIPHGGGGPGMGPIGVAKHLMGFLPRHPLTSEEDIQGISPLSSAPWGSALILLISWAYIKLMGDGLTRATKVAILNANYIARRLDGYFPVLYKGKGGFVAHEAILDLRPLKSQTDIDADDVAKRLMDYGFHAPTMHFPVPGTLMVEPTESESKEELDRFCTAMICIHGEIMAVQNGTADAENNLFKNAPHTLALISADEWLMPYSRQEAALPVDWLYEQKNWPTVGRLNNTLGDRNLVCSCLPIEAYNDS